jgi:hypothetical protein
MRNDRSPWRREDKEVPRKRATTWLGGGLCTVIMLGHVLSADPLPRSYLELSRCRHWSQSLDQPVWGLSGASPTKKETSVSQTF